MSEPPPRNRPAAARFLLVLLGITAVELGLVLLLIARPGLARNVVPVLLAPVVGVYIAFVASAAFRLLWNPALAPYPALEPAPGAVRRGWQSFSLGIVNMGLSIHVAVDEGHLHLTPLRAWRALGARAASIPWTALVPVGRSGRVARVGGDRGPRLQGPAWCMRLVDPGAARR